MDQERQLMMMVKKDPFATGYPALMLLGGTCFIMVIVYMTNCHVKVVSNHTWSMVSSAVSIFCAVMTNNWLNDVVNKLFGLSDEDPANPSIGSVFASVAQVAFYWLLVTTLLSFFKDSILRLKGYGTIGGHIMGFASVGLWTKIICLEPFKTSPWWIVPVVLIIYYVSMGAFFYVMMIVSKKMNSKGMTKEDKERWHDQVQDTATDFLSLGGAFLLVSWAKFLIIGVNTPALADPNIQHTLASMWYLGFSGIVFLLIGAGVAVVHHKKSDGGGALIDLLSSTMSVAASMCFLDVFNWRILPSASSLAIGKVKVAFILSVLAAGFIMVMAAISGSKDLRRVLRGSFTGLALAVGSSWEKTFDVSVDGLHVFGFTQEQRALITITLVIIVFPAWMVYFLPKADSELKEMYKKKPAPIWAACGCDQDPFGEEEDEYEDEAGLE